MTSRPLAVSLAALFCAACGSSVMDTSTTRPAFRIDAAAPPDCNYVMTIPPLPSASAKIDSAGNVQLEVFAYVQVPVTTRAVSARPGSGDLVVDITSTAATETFCKIPLVISNLDIRPTSLHVKVHHGGGRPLTDLHVML
jgi:hypothetical protein